MNRPYGLILNQCSFSCQDGIMKPLKPFDYFEPRSVPEACNLLAEEGEAARLLAGGTDLLVRMKKGEVNPSALINLKGVQGLNGIEGNAEKALSIGALT